MNKIKLLYLTPHLSTGGMPQFVLKRIEEIIKNSDRYEIFLVEYSKFSSEYTVQREEIVNILGEDHFFTLGDTSDTGRKYDLIDIIKENQIDIVHSEEMIEGFESFNSVPVDLMNMLYSPDRTWKIVETCHNIWFNPATDKKLKPEAYSLVSPHHMNESFSTEDSFKELHMYPYTDKSKISKKDRRDALLSLDLDPDKIHVINVGLWTRGKNQIESIKIAREVLSTNPNIEFHFIGNLAPNFNDYWGEIVNDLPENVRVWGERKDVDKFMIGCDAMVFNSLSECNPLVIREAIGYGKKILARNLPQYHGIFDGYITAIDEKIGPVSGQFLNMLHSDSKYKVPNDIDFGDKLIKFYDKVMDLEIVDNKSIANDYKFNLNFIRQPYFELTGTSNNKFKVDFLNDGNLSYSTELPFNSWTKLNKRYYIKWETNVYENDNLIYSNVLDLNGKRVYISFDSRSLGDTLAWIPYVEEFRKIHNCDVIVSTFLNPLFINQYKNIEFINPGDPVDNIYAQYNIGWYYDSEGNVDYDRVPNDFRKQPLQKTATDILGLEYSEIRPLLNLTKTGKKKKVGIGIHSTAQSKYWNNKYGWQDVVDYLLSMGYEVMLYSKENDGYMGNYHPSGISKFEGDGLPPLINDLATCEFFIGLSSGLSWLAWSVDIPVILISGFTEKYCEPTTGTYRIINEDVCHGCFNRERLDAGDWNWCPDHKNTDRMFECTKSIKPNQVINEIKKIIMDDNNIEIEPVALEDTITIVLSHADNQWRKNLLKECIEKLDGEIILSSNYPVDSDIQELCDWVLYTKNNPLLLKGEFEKYNVSYNYWHFDENGEKVYSPMEYEHGYAAYTLIQNGIKLANQLGKKKIHVINYDYIIDNETILRNNKKLDEFDCIFYFYDDNTYDFNSFCSGFFSGKTDVLDSFYGKFTSKDDYYTKNNVNVQLEKNLYDFYKSSEFKIFTDKFSDLKRLNVTNREGVLMFANSEDFNRFKYISDKYECDKTSNHEYHKIYPSILDPIINDNFSLFEIGIDRGKSVNLWRDYLKNAKIYGMDIGHEWTHDRGRIFKGDQNNIADLDFIIDRIDKCKVIIDDGSHKPDHQIKTFYHLFSNLLVDGGYYIIEDIETSYWDPASTLYGYEMGNLNIVDYFTKLNHQVNFKYNGYKNELNIEYIKFASNCIIIKKYDSLKQDKNTDNSGLFDSFNWGNQPRTYKNTMINELVTENIYQKFFGVDSGDIVLDIGASLGPFTYSILNKNPKHVYCFEPYDEFFEILVKNTEGKQVTNINAGISHSDGTADNDKLLFNSDASTQSSMNSITFKKFIDDNNLERIDFLKTDCEGGEYEIFNEENFDYIKNNVRKISGEWHLNEEYEPGIKNKFRKFRDLYLKNFDKYEVFSIDGIDIKWDLWNEHFIEYYNEVLIYIDNR